MPVLTPNVIRVNEMIGYILGFYSPIIFYLLYKAISKKIETKDIFDKGYRRGYEDGCLTAKQVMLSIQKHINKYGAEIISTVFVPCQQYIPKYNDNETE